MKTTGIIFLLFLAMCISCKKDSNTIKGFYDSMHFVRYGGGQIEFTIYPTDNPDQFNAVVTKCDFRDTTIQFSLSINQDYTSAFSSLNKAMNNQIQINGDFKQSTLATGTWSFIYLAGNGKETEVTNTKLRDSLLLFEKLIRTGIQ